MENNYKVFLLLSNANEDEKIDLSNGEIETL